MIDQVGPGGDYLGHAHTLAYFREFWQPISFNRQRLDGWQRSGGKRAGERLRERTVALMRSHQTDPLPDSVRQAVAELVE